LGLIDRILGKKKNQTNTIVFELLNDEGEGFFTLGDKLFKSDIVRACIRPKARAIGKLKAKHIRENNMECKVNPDPWIQNVLEEPNQFMSGQLLQEKLATQLDLNNNAFAYIKRNEYGYPAAVYPIPCTRIEVLENKQGEILLKFTFKTGKVVILPYDDIIHLRQDFNESDLFGDSPYDALFPLLEVVDTIDDTVVQTVSNSRVAKWLLNFNEVLGQEEMIKNADEFVNNYMQFTGQGVKAGISEPLYNIQQVSSNSYVPEAQRSFDAMRRIYSFFNTNEKIVQSTYNENEWNTYYESVIDPIAIQLNNEFTRKFFSQRERSVGNRIVFETSNLKFASLTTKLNLSVMVDRASLTPNEWRSIMGLGPIMRGNTPIRTLNIAPIDEKEKDREWQLQQEREKKREEERKKCIEECCEKCPEKKEPDIDKDDEKEKPKEKDKDKGNKKSES
jgi:HK97 family phage portal protein